MSDARNAWLGYADRLLRLCNDVFEQAQFAEEDKTLSNPKIVALALLCRTSTHFSALRALLENDFVVEARVLARCCYENLFWIGGLSKNGEEFVAKIVHHSDKHRMKIGNDLLRWAKKQNEPIDFEGTLEAFLSKMNSETPAGSPVDFRYAAEAGSLGDGYIIYRILSTDAAHPSAGSLTRHVVTVSDNGIEYLTLVAEPPTNPAEVDDTLELGCSALLGVCIGANSLVGGTVAGEELGGMIDEFKKMQANGDRIKSSTP